MIESLFQNLRRQNVFEKTFDILDFNLELTEVAEIDSLNKNARQGKDPDDVSIGDLK